MLPECLGLLASLTPFRAPVPGCQDGAAAAGWQAEAGCVGVLFVEYVGYRGLSASKASLTSGAQFGGGAKESAVKKSDALGHLGGLVN